MIFEYKTNAKPLTIKISVKVRTPKTKINIVVRDKDREFSVYQERYKTIDDVFEFFVRMPLTPNNCIIEVWNERGGRRAFDSSFVVKVEILELKRLYKENDIPDKFVKSFVLFAEEFCQKCGYLSSGTDGKFSVYVSDDSQYRINYFSTIPDRETGKPLNTPARIGKETGIMDISSERFKSYTIPERLAVIFHEFSHFWINGNQNNEQEADFNALLLFLGLGFPKTEAQKVFLRVFYNTPSDGNKKRWEEIKKMILNFEKNGLNYNPKYYYKGEM